MRATFAFVYINLTAFVSNGAMWWQALGKAAGPQDSTASVSEEAAAILVAAAMPLRPIPIPGQPLAGAVDDGGGDVTRGATPAALVNPKAK